MARFIALFALVVGAAAVQSVQEQQKINEQLESTSIMLEQMLKDFEHKDLKDTMVYQEYQAVRVGAKQAASLLATYQSRFPPAPTDWHNDDDEMEAEDIEVEQIEKAALKAKEQEQEEEADHIVVEKEEPKKVDRKTAKKMKLKAQELRKAEKLATTSEQKLAKFSSPYRAASKTEAKEIDVIDEGMGNYGKYQSMILGSSLIEEEPKKILSLEDTIAKREKELRLEALEHKKAIALSLKAKKLCAGDTNCIDKVDRKLGNGFYDRELKAKVKGNKV